MYEAIAFRNVIFGVRVKTLSNLASTENEIEPYPIAFTGINGKRFTIRGLLGKSVNITIGRRKVDPDIVDKCKPLSINLEAP